MAQSFPQQREVEHFYKGSIFLMGTNRWADQKDATITFNWLAIKDDPKYLLLMQNKS